MLRSGGAGIERVMDSTPLAAALLPARSPAGAAQTIPNEIVDFVESGVSILVGTRDAGLRPATMRGVGARVDASRRELTVYLPTATAARTVANLRDNGEIAVAFSRPIDHVAVQLKGRCREVRPARAAERDVPERYAVAFMENTYAVGMPRSLMKRLCVWPAWAVTFAVRDVFSQTPGPGAGKRWTPR